MPAGMQRPRLPEVSESQRKAKQAWNEGLVGKGRAASITSVVEVCTVDVCGTAVTSRRAPAEGMVQVRGAADGAAAHWYCPDRCAAIARACAELRDIPMRPGGDG